jgi:subtilisin family serine protease
VIAAAGNLGPDGPPRYPAAYAEVIAVTAVDLLGQTYEHANRGPYIDVAAPGVHIWSAGASGHGKFFDGTSFATPFVTAEVALLRLAEPQRSPPELKAVFHSATGSTDSVHAGAPSASVLKSRGCDR